MIVYRLKSTGEINPHITAEVFSAWVAIGIIAASRWDDLLAD